MVGYGRRIGGKLLSKRLPYLYIFLAADAAFIFLHILYLDTGHPQYNLGLEGSYSETFQHYKEALIVLLLGMLAVRLRFCVYWSWSLLFLYILLDDTFAIHERLGKVVAEKKVLGKTLALGDIFNLKTDDLGELVVWAFFGLFLLLGVAAAYRYSSDRASKQVSKYLFILLVIYAIPGVVLDKVHEMVYSDQAQRLLTLPEDGGELIAMSIIAWYVLLQVQVNTKKLSRSEQGENISTHLK